MGLAFDLLRHLQAGQKQERCNVAVGRCSDEVSGIDRVQELGQFFHSAPGVVDCFFQVRVTRQLPTNIRARIVNGE
jgi:hypothetical protein